jgi:hypothetical protein
VFGLAEMRRHDHEGEGFLRNAFTRMSTVLVRRGLAPHNEPEEQLVAWAEDQPTELTENAMARLGSLLADTWDDLPVRESERAQLGVVDLRSHLIAHSTISGFFLPQQFDPPLYAEGDEPELPDGLVGSSVALRAELEALRPRLPDNAALHASWQLLATAADTSIAYGTAIWLH